MTEPAPGWYKRAVFYEAPVYAFGDSDGDGIGDFPGLTARLDYLQWLGVDCIWLLPFYESPLHDGGYDVSDFEAVLPRYGNVENVVAFLAAAHERGLRVITDMIVNHTSDQHPWFQAARQPGSPTRSRYVWSETPDRYPRRPGDLHRHPRFELVLGSRGGRLLLASLLRTSAGSELRRSLGAQRDQRRRALLVGQGLRRPAPRRRPVSVRAGRDER